MLTGVQTAESFLAWREEDGKKPQLAKSIPTPITVELQKGPLELGGYTWSAFPVQDKTLYSYT